MSISKDFRIHLDDLDFGGIVSHYNWLRLMERHRTDLLRDDWKKLISNGFGMVIVNIDVQYQRPARYDDEIEVKIRITDLKNSSFSAEHIFTDKKSGKVCVSGVLTFAVVSLKTNKAVEITPEFRQILEKLR